MGGYFSKTSYYDVLCDLNYNTFKPVGRSTHNTVQIGTIIKALFLGNWEICINICIANPTIPKGLKNEKVVNIKSS